MASVKIDVEELDASIFGLKLFYELSLTESSIFSMERTGAGKVSDELLSFRESINFLIDSLSNFHTSVEAFLTCIKEGTLSADEYGAKSLEVAQEKWKSGGER